MSEQSQTPPRTEPAYSQPYKLFVVVSLCASFPFLGLSAMLFGGMLLSVAFTVDFAVENRTGQPITVTPVGTVGRKGKRAPLPIVLAPRPAFPAYQRGGYSLEPGGSVRLFYDMDDINFSEIVVRDAHGPVGQVVVNPNPTVNQYRAPLERKFVIHDLVDLDPIPAPVLEAAQTAEEPPPFYFALIAIIVLPWPIFSLFSYLNWKIENSCPKPISPTITAPPRPI